MLNWKVFWITIGVQIALFSISNLLFDMLRLIIVLYGPFYTLVDIPLSVLGVSGQVLSDVAVLFGLFSGSIFYAVAAAFLIGRMQRRQGESNYVGSKQTSLRAATRAASWSRYVR